MIEAGETNEEILINYPRVWEDEYRTTLTVAMWQNEPAPVPTQHAPRSPPGPHVVLVHWVLSPW